MTFLASGGGEMGALIRAKDWSTTALGPIETWPKSLTTMLGAVLNTRFPMALWWGPDLLQLYNDAYRPILRDKHPALLGAPTSDVWAEIWDVVGPLATGVQTGGPATWTEDLQLFIKNGDISEETYFTFSFSAVPSDEGGAEGLLVTVQETTVKVQSERQIRMLHDLAARAAQAKSEDVACGIAFEVLAGNDLDLPFALLYVLDEGAAQPRLAGSVGWSQHEVSPNAGFPFAEILEGTAELLVNDLAERFGPLLPGRWNTRPTQAVMLPLLRAGQSTPYAVFIAGVSPHRTLDERYRRFFRATADQVANVITNARAYEAEKKRAEGLIELDRAKTAFFSNVSHEFRTPLTLILGPIENAIAREDKALRGEDLDAVHRSALRLLRLVTSLLDFARAEAGRFELSVEPLDLAAVTAGLAGSFQSLIEDAGMRLIVDCPALPEPVYVDRTHWEKIVLNLISNAFKFTFEGEIEVALRFHGDHVELCVRDTGTGIAEAELPRIFERFHRVEGARGRSFEGTGIGLALVQELVKLHGGSVSVSSQQGRGTRFVVSIPTGDAHVPANRLLGSENAEARDAQARVERVNPHVLEAFHWNEPRHESNVKDAVVDAPALPEPFGGRDSILVADDNADMREYLVRMLKPHWHVETVADGQAALTSMRARLPDLLLSDVMMPVMDGAALVQAIRSDPKTRAVPVILLSARAGQEAVLDGLETGADDYLVKPFSARELLTRVKTHLQMARVRRAAQSQLVQSAKMASLGELVAGIAHEINNPLAFALSHLDTVRRVLSEIDAAGDSADPTSGRLRWDRAYDRLREMRVGLERIHELVIKLRTFSRLDEGEQKRVSVRENIESVVMILKHRLGGITLTTQFGEPDLIECYPGLLNQAVMNLVSNAIDASTHSGAITITTGAEGPWYAITVSDCGVGIDENIRERILEPFFTTKPAGQGTGLGLSITYSIVQRHGGQLELNARPEGGTTAIIRIPLAQAH